MGESRSTLTEFVPHVSTSFPIRAFSAVRSAIWVTFIQDNPLTWWWQQGRRNYRADMEGTPYQTAPCTTMPSRIHIQARFTCMALRVARSSLERPFSLKSMS